MYIIIIMMWLVCWCGVWLACWCGWLCVDLVFDRHFDALTDRLMCVTDIMMCVTDMLMLCMTDTLLLCVTDKLVCVTNVWILCMTNVLLNVTGGHSDSHWRLPGPDLQKGGGSVWPRCVQHPCLFAQGKVRKMVRSVGRQRGSVGRDGDSATKSR